MASLAGADVTQATRHADYGQRWGEGAARCFSIEGDFLDDAQGLRLMPVPDSFFCPISAAIMNDPVATVDGCAYEREYIERWFRERRQFRQPITSPTTGLELQSTTMMPLVALQRAIEAYLLHRPELKRDHLAGRSFEEAAQVLQIDLLEKQAMNASVHDEMRRLREANRALKRALQETEAACTKLTSELEQTKARAESAESKVEKNDSRLHVSSDDMHSVEEQSASSSTAPRSHPGKNVTRLQSPLAEYNARRDRLNAKSKQARPISTPEFESLSEDGGVEQSNCSKGLSQDSGWRFSHTALVVMVLSLCLFVAVFNHGIFATSTLGTKIESSQDDSSIAGQVERLRSASAEERIAAAHSLEQIAGVGADQQSAILEAGAARALVKLLEEVGSQVRRASASTLTALAMGGSEKQSAVARAGAIFPLVQILKSGETDATTAAAASTLRQLAVGNTKNQAAIASGGAIAPLVEIMRSDKPTARLEATVTLRKLVGEGLEKNSYRKQVTMVQAGAIPPLVKLMKADSAEVRQAAAGILRMMATNNADNQVAIAQAGAIGPLKDLLSDVEAGARQEAAAALDRLAVLDTEANFGNQVAIGQAGGVHELSKLLQDEVTDVAITAASALRSLVAGNNENLNAVHQSGGITGLVMLLKSDKVTLSVVSLLRTLAFHNTEWQASIADAGAIEPLVQLLKHQGAQIRGEAAGILAHLARGKLGEEIQAAVAHAGVSSDLLKG